MTFKLVDKFFKHDKLIRLSTCEKPLKCKMKRLTKKFTQSLLRLEMDEYLRIKPAASLTELAYAYLRNLKPPVCKTCGKLINFKRDNWASFCNAKCAMSNQEVNQKKTEYFINKLGVKHPMLTKISMDKKAIYHNKRTKVKELKAESKNRVQIKLQNKQANILKKESERQNLLDLKIKPLIKDGFSDFKFGKNGKIIQATHECGTIQINPRLPTQCYICHAPKKESAQFKFTNLINKPYERNKRLDNKMQLDAYFKEENIAIEYNGLYWHSSAPKPGVGRSVNKFYHQEKMLQAKKEGIRLLTIWEDQARDENFIYHVNSLFHAKKVFARKCNVLAIDSSLANEFLKINHRDGKCAGASYNYGLYYLNELVLVMSVGRNRFKGPGLEIYRLSTKLGYQIIGGVSKIIKTFRSLHSDILSTYSSADWGWGEAYMKADGKLIGLTKPGYFYFDQKTGRRINRLGLSKGNFEKTTGLIWDVDLNEEDNAKRAKCWMVWNCGNWKYEWAKI